MCPSTWNVGILSPICVGPPPPQSSTRSALSLCVLHPSSISENSRPLRRFPDVVGVFKAWLVRSAVSRLARSVSLPTPSKLVEGFGSLRVRAIERHTPGVPTNGVVHKLRRHCEHTHTHTKREACETSIPNLGCGWGPRTTSASGSLLRYQTAPATKPTKTAR